MPVYQGNQEINAEYVDGYGLGEIYLGTQLIQSSANLNPFIRALGGTITFSGSYKIHTYTTIGTSSFDIVALGSGSTNNSIEYLVVAGGGAGGIQTNGQGPGGGAGGFLTGSLIATSSNSNQVIVGAGGSGTNASANPSSGSNSSIFNILAYGGGCFGNSVNFAGQGNPNGGSGAGSGSGTAGQGFDGGTLYVPGGGGAGQAGQNGTNSPPLFAGNGGSGSLSSINGTATYYAGGGAGGGIAGDANNRTPGTGGVGGGGDGGSFTGNVAARSGKDATYYGGAGGGVGDIRSFTEAVSGNGYQGIIIVRYPYK